VTLNHFDRNVGPKGIHAKPARGLFFLSARPKAIRILAIWIEPLRLGALAGRLFSLPVKFKFLFLELEFAFHVFQRSVGLGFFDAGLGFEPFDEK
jgi:hypothetical protein